MEEAETIIRILQFVYCLIINDQNLSFDNLQRNITIVGNDFVVFRKLFKKPVLDNFFETIDSIDSLTASRIMV